MNKAFLSIPLTIWLLCIISFFMNISSVVISSLAPSFMIIALKNDIQQVGLIRGLTEAAGFFSQLFSGLISDYIGKRKWLIAIGYGCAAITKPIFALSSSTTWYAFGQLIDRVSNGCRDTPRDTLIADYSPKNLKSKCFSLRHGFATAGSVLGGLITCWAMWYTSQNYRLIFLWALAPVTIAFFLVVFFIQDHPDTNSLKKMLNNQLTNEKTPNLIKDNNQEQPKDKIINNTPTTVLPGSLLIFSILAAVLGVFGYWQITVFITVLAIMYWVYKNIIPLGKKELDSQYFILMFIVSIIMLARPTQAFLSFNLIELGLDDTYIPLVFSVLNLGFSIAASLVSVYSNLNNQKTILLSSLPLMIISYLILGNCTSIKFGMLGVFVYGVHLGCTQGIIPAMIVELTPKHLRATSLGFYNIICGFAIGVSSTIAGYIGKYYSVSMQFNFFCIIAILAFFLLINMNKLKKVLLK